MTGMWLGSAATAPDESWVSFDEADAIVPVVAQRVPGRLALPTGAHGAHAVLGWCAAHRCWPLHEMRLVGPTDVQLLQAASAGGRFDSVESPNGEAVFRRRHLDPVRRAYEQTEIVVEGLTPIRPGAATPHDAIASGSFHVITAHNPAGLTWSERRNAEAHAALTRAVQGRQLRCSIADGQATAQDHPAERGLAIWGLGDLEAIGLARDFGQVALFRVDETREVIDCEVVAFGPDRSTILDLAAMAPTMQRYRRAKAAWDTISAGTSDGDSEAHLRQLAPAGEWLLALAREHGNTCIRRLEPWSLPRDPDRTETILALLREAWTQDPDSRLGQLLSNALATRDGLFGVEDDRVEEALRRRLAKRAAQDGTLPP